MSLVVLDRQVERHERMLTTHAEQITELRVTVSTLAAKVAVYAALGATVGGGLVAVIVNYLVR